MSQAGTNCHFFPKGLAFHAVEVLEDVVTFSEHFQRRQASNHSKCLRQQRRLVELTGLLTYYQSLITIQELPGNSKWVQLLNGFTLRSALDGLMLMTQMVHGLIGTLSRIQTKRLSMQEISQQSLLRLQMQLEDLLSKQVRDLSVLVLKEVYRMFGVASSEFLNDSKDVEIMTSGTSDIVSRISTR